VEPGLGEVCDDGNTADRDGCSANCASDETCGNMVIDTTVGETCDDGNTISGDGCDSACQGEIGMCIVDEDLGMLMAGVPINRMIDVAAATDEWTTDCATAGPEHVLTFELPRPSNLLVLFEQMGHHNFGLYREGEVSATCNARNGICAATGPNDPINIRFLNRQPGLYYLIVESARAMSAGTGSVTVFMEGCAPSVDVGQIPVGVTRMASVNTMGGTAVFSAGCSGTPGGAEQVIAFELPATADLDISWMQSGDHVIGLFREAGGNCDDTPIACHDPVSMAAGSATFPRLPAGRYLVIVDAHDPGDEGVVNLGITAR